MSLAHEVAIVHSQSLNNLMPVVFILEHGVGKHLIQLYPEGGLGEMR